MAAMQSLAAGAAEVGAVGAALLTTWVTRKVTSGRKRRSNPDYNSTRRGDTRASQAVLSGVRAA